MEIYFNLEISETYESEKNNDCESEALQYLAGYISCRVKDKNPSLSKMTSSVPDPD